MANKQKHGAPADDAPAEPHDPTETPDHHVETSEEVYRSAADAAAPIPSAAQRVYGVSADAIYEAGTRMARHPWATLAAGALIGCVAGVLFKSRR
jgi:ElaB/YqjD/DUF883 family membrane-anchored ribosome-binding protein